MLNNTRVPEFLLELDLSAEFTSLKIILKVNEPK